MNVTNQTTMKVIGTLAAGVAGWMTVGSYGSSKPQWQVEANSADQKATLDYHLYKQTTLNTGNSFVPPILNYFSRPDFAFQHKFRRAYIYAKGFVKDVLWENIMPMGLGALALTWGFNLKATKVLGKAASLTGSGLKACFNATKSVAKAITTVMPKIEPWKAVSPLIPKSPKAVLTVASAAAIGLFMLPYAFFEAASGRSGKDVSDKYFNKF